MSVQNIEGCYEELVGVLLLVARQVSGVRPDEVEQLVEYQRRLIAAVELWGERCPVSTAIQERSCR